ncbi:MAG: hypothetical protein LBH16_02560 [Treponema sp.]|jgi:hypothetical protein|nr:hypothetical protein [Treponema sp.]
MNRCFLTTITIIAITAMAFTACNRGSGSSNQAGAFDAVKTAQAENAGSSNYEEQNDLHEYSSHQKIVPAFAGYYVNDSGNSIHLEPGGTFVMRQDGNSWENEIVGVFLNVNNPGSGNYFHWAHPAGDFGIYLVPAGVDIIMHGSILPTDKTKIRLITEDLHSVPVVYYQTGASSQGAYNYSKILAGDLSDFTGTWVNGQGEKARITADGVLQHNILAGGIRASDFSKTDGANTTYSWWVSQTGDGFGVNLHPAGTEVLDYYGQPIQTDKTKVRITIQSVSRSDEIYYREGELPPVTVNNDLVLGSWMFKSGRNVYFFGQAPSIDFLTDKTVNVYEQGDQYLRLARSGIWGYTPEGRLFVEYDWNTYYFLFSSDLENLIIIDSDGNRGVFGKVYG